MTYTKEQIERFAEFWGLVAEREWEREKNEEVRQGLKDTLTYLCEEGKRVQGSEGRMIGDTLYDELTEQVGREIMGWVEGMIEE